MAFWNVWLPSRAHRLQGGSLPQAWILVISSHQEILEIRPHILTSGHLPLESGLEHVAIILSSVPRAISHVLTSQVFAN